MKNTASLRDFWGADLEPLIIPDEMKNKFSQDTKLFLREYGLPKSERMFVERENFIRSTFPFPNWKFNVEIIKSLPIFEFGASKLAMINFGGEILIRIGNSREDEIAVE